MQRVIVFLVSIISIILVVYMIQHVTSETAMKYFPINENADFEQANTEIKIGSDPNTLEWSSYSNSEQAVYLRQDIGLLFENGKFKGGQSKWKENTAKVKMKQAFEPTKSSYLEGITLHHGEIHQNQDMITSMQYMTTAQQYVKVQHEKWTLLTDSDHQKDKELKEKLQKKRDAQLQESWKELLTHFELDVEDYHTIPLVDLERYNQDTLPGRTNDETKQIIGQLWEGLYKNYILELKTLKKEKTDHYMPLILISKKQPELLIIYELNGEKQLLKQKLP